MSRREGYARVLAWTTGVTLLVALGAAIAANVTDEPAQPAPAPAVADLVPPPPPAGLDVEDQAVYWRAQIDGILSAPCPREPTEGSTAIPDLAEIDPQWRGRVEAALRIHADACS